MFQADALTALERRGRLGPLLGILIQTFILAGLAWSVIGLDLAFWQWVMASGLLFSGLEVGVQRTRATRLEAVKPLYRALVEALGEAGQPKISWTQGLPRLEGRSQSAFAVHLETAGPRLRLGLTVAASPAATAWLASRQPQDFPTRLERRLSRHMTRLGMDGEGLCALSGEPAPAEVMLARPGVLAHLQELLNADAPWAASLELGLESARWDVALSPGITASRLILLVNTLPDLVAAPPSETPDPT